MLEEVLQQFDKKYLKKWDKTSKDLIQNLALGLEKVEFKADEPQAFITLRNLINEAQSAGSSKELADKVYEINKILNILTTEYDFKNPIVNGFIFNARVAINQHNLNLMKKDMGALAQGMLNPINKEKKNKKAVGYIKRKIAKKGANQAVQKLAQNFESSYEKPFAIYVQNMPNKTKINSYVMLDPKKEPSILAKRIGKEKYRELKSQIEINNAEDAVKYISEQLYGNAFETYYTHIALLYDALEKIETIATLNENTKPSQKKTELLSKYGLKEANSQTSRQYMDQIANYLGFNDAKKLHENFLKINNPDDYENLKKIKAQFMENSNNHSVLEDDPLESIFKISDAEYKRISAESEKNNFIENSSAYISIFEHFNNLKYQIQTIQRGKNAGELVAKEKLDPKRIFGDEPNFLQRMMLQAGHYLVNNLNFKEYLDSYTLGIFVENQLFEKRLNDIIKPIDNELIALTKENIYKKNKLIKHLLKTEWNDEKRIEQLVDLKQKLNQIKKTKDQLDQKADPTTHHEKQNEINHINQKYEDYRIAYEIKTNEHLGSQNKLQLEQKFKQVQSEVNYLNDKKDSIKNKIKKLKNKERVQKANDNKVPKIFLKWWSNLVRLTGYKTTFYKEREERIKTIDNKINVLTEKSERSTLKMSLRTEQLDHLKKQIALINHYEAKSPSILVGDLKEMREALNQAYQNVESNYHTLSQYKKDLILAQQEYLEIESKFNIVLKTLHLKLHQGSLSLNDVQLLLDDIKNAKEFLKEINHEIISPYNKYIHPPLDQTLYSLESKLEGIILEEAKIKVDSFLAVNPIKNDPFAFLQSDHKSLIDVISKETLIKLYDYANQKYLAKIATEAPSLDLDELLEIHFNMQLGYYFYHDQKNTNKVDSELAGFYTVLTKSILDLINLKFDSLEKLNATQIQTEMKKLDLDFIRIYQLKLDTAQKAESENETYQSYLWNAFGLFKKEEEVKRSLDYALANEHQLFAFMDRYATLLNQFIIKAPEYYKHFDQDKLNDEINRLENNIEAMTRIFKDDPTNNESIEELLENYKKLLLIVKNIEKSHPNYELVELERETEHQKNQIENLNKEAQHLHNKVYIDNVFDENDYQRYHELFLLIKDNIREHKTLLSELKLANQRIGVHYSEFDRREHILSKKLIAQERLLADHQKHFEKELNFYHEIAEGNSPNIKHQTNKSLGKGLIIAIQNNNINVTNNIMSNSSEKLDGMDLSNALKLAAQMNNTETFNKILQTETLHQFSDKDLSDCIYKALDNNNKDIVYLILANTNITLNDSLIKLLQEMLVENHPGFELKRGLLQGYLPQFMQNYTDNDAFKLQHIREGFIIQDQILKFLAKEHSAIQEQQMNLSPHETLQAEALRVEMNAFLRKVQNAKRIRDKMIAFYNQQEFDTPDRKKEHIERWTDEIELVESNYIKTIKLYKLTTSDTPKTSSRSIPKVADQVEFLEALSHPLESLAHPTLVSESVTEPSLLLSNTLANEETIHHDPSLSNVTLFNKNEKFYQAYEIIEKQIEEPSKHSFYGVVDNLTIMKDNLSADTQSLYYSTLLKTIAAAAKNGKNDELNSIFELVDDLAVLNKLKQEALYAAFSAGRVDTVSLLLRKKAYLENELELLHQLYLIPDELETRVNAFQHSNFEALAFQLLVNMPITLDAQAMKLINDIANDIEKNSPNRTSIQAVKVNWIDKDAPHLNSIRHAYVVAEKMYHMIEKEVDELYLEFDSLKESDELTNNKIKEYKDKLSDLKTALEHQKSICDDLIVKCYEFKEPNIQNKESRLKTYIETWDNDLYRVESACNHSLTEYESKFKQAFKEAKNYLKEETKRSPSYRPSQFHSESEKNIIESSSSKKPPKIKPST